MTRRRRHAKTVLLPKNPNATSKPPIANALFTRLQKALDVPLERVAEITGMLPGDLLELQATPDARLGELDATFESTLAYVNARLGMLIALRSELEARLYKSRQAAIARRQLIRGNE